MASDNEDDSFIRQVRKALDRGCLPSCMTGKRLLKPRHTQKTTHRVCTSQIPCLKTYSGTLSWLRTATLTPGEALSSEYYLSVVSVKCGAGLSSLSVAVTLVSRSWIEVSSGNALLSPITGQRMGEALEPNEGAARLLQLAAACSSKSVARGGAHPQSADLCSDSEVCPCPPACLGCH